MRYSCNDIFMVRTPSLPASVFSDFVQFEGNDVENFLQQTPFRDFMDKSILLSSRELYNAKKRNLQSSTKKSKARNLARIKFLIRACTRPTPYGLFAGAALGEFCENPNIEPLVIDERKAILECRADYSWLSHFIYEMENNPSVYPQLQLRFNNNCYVSGDRLKNPHHSNHGFLMPEETVTERTHMRNTPLITYVKQQAQTFIRYDLLKSRIQSKYPGVPEEKIISTINALMENEVLLSNLRAPANCENGLEYVLKILAPIEGINRQKETLQKINTLINQMNGELEIDQVNAKTIESVYTLMDGLLNQKNEKDLLAVNKGMVLQQNKLPYQVKEIVEQFVEALTYLQVDVPSRLEKFKRQCSATRFLRNSDRILEKKAPVLRNISEARSLASAAPKTAGRPTQEGGLFRLREGRLLPPLSLPFRPPGEVTLPALRPGLLRAPGRLHWPLRARRTPSTRRPQAPTRCRQSRTSTSCRCAIPSRPCCMRHALRGAVSTRGTPRGGSRSVSTWKGSPRAFGSARRR